MRVTLEKRPTAGPDAWAVRGDRIGADDRLARWLVEHRAGEFPTWLAPVQVMVLRVSAKFAGPARRLRDRLLDAGVRAETDVTGDSLARQIRRAELRRIPHILVLGRSEVETGTVHWRRRRDRGQQVVAEADFIAAVQQLDRDRVADAREPVA